MSGLIPQKLLRLSVILAVTLLLGAGCAGTAETPVAISVRRLSSAGRDLTFPEYLRRTQMDRRVASVLGNRNLICGAFLIKNGSSRELIISYLGEPVPDRVKLIRADGNSYELTFGPHRIRPADGADHEIHLKSEFWELPEDLGDSPILYAVLMQNTLRLSRETKVWTFNVRSNQWEVAPPAKLIEQWSNTICPDEE